MRVSDAKVYLPVRGMIELADYAGDPHELWVRLSDLQDCRLALEKANAALVYIFDELYGDEQLKMPEGVEAAVRAAREDCSQPEKEGPHEC